MFLITSAAYISSGLSSEFGKLPPCMLPVQNCRLYEHQVKLVSTGEKIVLSLPKSYQLPEFDAQKLDNLGVRTIFVPDGLSLGQSVIYVLNAMGCYNEPIRILHGDTLFSEISTRTDVSAIANAEDAYDWTSAGNNDGKVYSGFFCFSDQSLLIRKITDAGYAFMNGIKGYATEKKVNLLEMPGWMDFGLVNSYYRSISKMTTQRVFNSMEITRYSVRKSSLDKQKMKAEANWLSSLPTPMKHYAPSVWDSGEKCGRGYYEIEYYFLSSIANLFVFGRNNVQVWKEIVDACCDYLNDEYQVKAENSQHTAVQNDMLYAEKTMSRLEEYVKSSTISLLKKWIINGVEVPSLKEIVKYTDNMISKQDERFATLMHGDPCFSNILYDFKSKTIKVLDPRGIDSQGNVCIYGDFRYDVAKLAHSILGMYDFIIGGRFKYSEKGTYDLTLEFDNDKSMEQVQDYFQGKSFGGYSLDELSVYAILVHLFLSMLPLHKDHPKRQKAMLANALRIYAEFIQKKNETHKDRLQNE